MNKIILISVFVVSFCIVTSAQTELNSKGEPVAKNVQNAPVQLKTGAKISRGAALVDGVKKVSIAKVFADPDKYAGKTVTVEGVIVRSCKKEGCWMEIAAKEDLTPVTGAASGGPVARRSVRVTFGDHAFYIPLNSAGMTVRAQGVFRTKVLSKEHVDHLINDDGAKFDKRNPDGTVTEVSFDATGVELTKAS